MNLHLLRGVFSGLIADLAGYVRGSIFRGGAAVWEVHAAQTAGHILVGDGTDIRSVAIDGDATLIGVLDTRYLKLDASNDPVTAGLEINAATAAEPVLILQTTDDNATNPVLEVQASGGGMLSEIQADGDILLTDGVKMLLGTGADGQIYSSADNLYLDNVVLNKDIIFRGTTTAGLRTFALVDASKPFFEIRSTAATARALLLRAAAGQTQRIVEWVTSVGGYLGGIGADGSLGMILPITQTAGTTNAMTLSMKVNTAGASTAQYRGFFGGPNVNAGNAQNYTGEFTGLQAQLQHRGTGTVSNMIGIQGITQNLSTGTITNARGIWIRDISNLGGGVVTNVYGIYMDGQSAGAALNYSIFTTRGLVHFGDQVEILGLDAADIQLVVRGAAAQSADLQEWQDSTTAILSRINKDGYIMTRKVAAPADGDLVASELAFWFDNTNGNAFAMFKGKTADGTVVTGSVALV